MKKLLTVLFVLGLVLCSTVHGDLEQDLNDLRGLRSNNLHEEAISKSQEILNNHSEAEVSVLAIVKYHMGLSHRNLKNHEEAIQVFQNLVDNYPESGVHEGAILHMGLSHRNLNNHEEAIQVFQNLVDNYPDASSDQLVRALMHMGSSYMDLNKYDNAVSTFQIILNDYPNTTVNRLSRVKFDIGMSYRFLGQHENATLSFVEASTSYGFISLGHQKRVFELVNPIHLGVEEYKKYLTNLQMIVPAVPENVEFLGKVSSQLDVLR